MLKLKDFEGDFASDLIINCSFRVKREFRDFSKWTEFRLEPVIPEGSKKAICRNNRFKGIFRSILRM